MLDSILDHLWAMMIVRLQSDKVLLFFRLLPNAAA